MKKLKNKIQQKSKERGIGMCEQAKEYSTDVHENQKCFWKHIDETKWYVLTEIVVKKSGTVPENASLE